MGIYAKRHNETHQEYRDRVTKDAKYISMRKMWREYEAGLTIINN